MAAITANPERDLQASDLIDAAQSYSNPTGWTPTPPPSAYPASSGHREGEELARGPVPPWFDPIDHPDDREPHRGEDSEEVPVIDGEGEVATPSLEEESMVGSSGPDALAYYAPFHFFRRTRWGIYIRDYGVVYLASQFLRRKRLTRSDNWALRCAYWLLFEHEYFHFQTEIAATRYEVLTGNLKAYGHLFYDRRAHWLEEGMANARAHRNLHDHEDDELTFPRIDHFRGFVSQWMKQQPPGYRDYDRWCKSWQAMDRGRAAVTSRLHEISSVLRHSRGIVNSNVLRPYASADYSRVPVVRIRDSQISQLKSAKLFPKAHGIRVIVYTREHPPAHIHIELLDSSEFVRLGWPSLTPLPGEPTLSTHQIANLKSYVATHGGDINEKVQKVFHQPNLTRAV